MCFSRKSRIFSKTGRIQVSRERRLKITIIDSSEASSYVTLGSAQNAASSIQVAFLFGGICCKQTQDQTSVDQYWSKVCGVIFELSR